MVALAEKALNPLFQGSKRVPFNTRHRQGGEPDGGWPRRTGHVGGLNGAPPQVKIVPMRELAGIDETDNDSTRLSEIGIGQNLEKIVAMAVSQVTGSIAPTGLLQVLPMPLVLGIDDESKVLPDDAQIGDESPLGARAAGLPFQVPNRFVLSAGAEGTACAPGEAGELRFDPGFEETLHRHDPGDAFEVTETGKAAVVDGPIDGLDPLTERLWQ